MFSIICQCSKTVLHQNEISPFINTSCWHASFYCSAAVRPVLCFTSVLWVSFRILFLSCYVKTKQTRPVIQLTINILFSWKILPTLQVINYWLTVLKYGLVFQLLVIIHCNWILTSYYFQKRILHYLQVNCNQKTKVIWISNLVKCIAL